MGEFSLNTQIPLSQDMPANPVQQMGAAVSLANMLQQRQQGQAQIQRQQQMRDVFSNPPTDASGAVDQAGMFQQVAAIDPETGMKMQDQAAQAAQRNAEAKRWESMANLNAQKIQTQLDKTQSKLAYEQANHGAALTQSILEIANQPGFATDPVAQETAKAIWDKNVPTMVQHGGYGQEFAGHEEFDPTQTPMLSKTLNSFFNDYLSKTEPNYKATTGTKSAENIQGMKNESASEVQDLKNQGAKLNRPSATNGPGLQLSQKQEQFDEQQWAKLMKSVNPLSASSRSVLGVAGTSNMRADRALAILNDPKAGPSEIKALVDTDILGIMKGGVPDAEQLKNGLISTFGTDLQQKLQYWSSNPQQFNNSDVRNRLIEITKGLKAVDNKILTDALGAGAASYGALIGRHPDWWKNGMASITQIGAGMDNHPTSSAAAAPIVTKHGKYDMVVH